MHLRQRILRRIPVKADLRRFLLHLLRTHERWKTLAHVRQHTALRHKPLFSFLEFFPAVRNLLRCVAVNIAEDVRVAVKHFVDDGGRNVLHREFIRRRCNICMERHLQQHVTKLIRQMIHIALIDRADCLVRFLNQIAAEGLMRLFTIPRALAAHLVHDALQVLKAVPGALLKRNGGQIQADRVVIGVQAVHLPKLDVLRLTVRLDGGWKQHRRQLVAVNIAQAQFQVTCQ